MRALFVGFRRYGRVLWLALVPVVLTAGCGGFTATKSISPLDFFLPGLHLRVDPPQPPLPEGANTNTFVCWQSLPAMNQAQDVASGVSPALFSGSWAEKSGGLTLEP